jgi:hypothetical protein
MARRAALCTPMIIAEPQQSLCCTACDVISFKVGQCTTLEVFLNALCRVCDMTSKPSFVVADT